MLSVLLNTHLIWTVYRIQELLLTLLIYSIWSNMDGVHWIIIIASRILSICTCKTSPWILISKQRCCFNFHALSRHAKSFQMVNPAMFPHKKINSCQINVDMWVEIPKLDVNWASPNENRPHLWSMNDLTAWCINMRNRAHWKIYSAWKCTALKDGNGWMQI